MQQSLKWAFLAPALVWLAACGPGKKEEPQCPAGQTSCDGACTDTQTDGANCGACGKVCGTGTVCKAGTCTATCGDGVKADIEACDDGNLDPGDGCDATCAIEKGWSCQGSPSTCTTGCGDGVVAGMEACDDGNTDNGDGCSASCGIEEGFSCSGEPSACVTTCGDSIVAGDETCDDGDTDAGDGCSDTCAVETGYTCSGAPSVCTTTCGDGLAAGAEVCDDGNLDNGDGCSSTCAVENGFTCTGTPSDCTTTCGDGIPAGTETCDDGNTDAGDGCSDTCAVETGYTCSGAPSNCATKCGDGLIVGAETCDDGNLAVGDGCDTTCLIENGWSCSGEPSTCMTTCGDGILAGIETCDDGNPDANDGCSDTCTVEAGYTCFGMPSTCQTMCGDGVITGAEACDDNNTTAGDGCDASCAVESGFTCSGTPSVCAPPCGDGLIVGAEECDDGNPTSGDGCSAQCAVELGYVCSGTPSICNAQLTCQTGSTLVALGASDLPQVVSNASPASSVINVSSGGVVTDVAVGVRLPHAYDGDVTLTLTDPSGTTVDLSVENGSSGDNYTDTWFNDAATTSITDGSAPFTGQFKPEQPLSTYFGAAANGDWTLSATDSFSSDDGTLEKFTLLVCVCTNCEIGAACGDSVDNDGDGDTDCSDADCASAAACAVCGDGLIVGAEACDDGNTNSGDGCSATCQLEFGYNCSGEPTVCTPLVSCPAGSTFHAYQATALPLSFSDMAPASSTIQVTTPGTVVDAAVRVNIDHNWTEDVDLTLAAPDGTTVELSTDNGGSGDDYVDTLFTDGATDSIINGTPPFTGSFQPEQPLSSVSSQTAAGDWTLHAVDDESGIDGKILGYDLFLCVTP